MLRSNEHYLAHGSPPPGRIGTFSGPILFHDPPGDPIFRAQVGETPGSFLERQRLSHAAHLLRLTDQAVGEIARECGFEEPFYFTNRFRRHHGMSPSKFRLASRSEYKGL